MIILLANRAISRLNYQDYDDKKDCLQTALMHCFQNWRNFDTAFTEQGVAMLSSVLNSPRAIAINIQIMRVFVKMRQMIISYKDLLEKIEKLEASDLEQNKHIRNIYDLIKELLEPPVKKQRPIGFRIRSNKKGQY
jgi:hypothetical protein